MIGRVSGGGRHRADRHDPARALRSSSTRRSIPTSSTTSATIRTSWSIWRRSRRQPRRVAAYRSEIARRWDLEALRADVVASQRRRRLVFEALTRGGRHSWDHQPPHNAAEQYMRNHIDLDDLEAMARFPAVRRGT